MSSEMAKYSHHRQCNFNDVKCLKKNMIIINSLQPPEEKNGFDQNDTVGVNCNCLPNCHETVS